ncbi:PREDICTED: uncharacterized protein LOC105974051 [Erythranthe guttata]|uniref:uncharacterized protein LOC105974051 n=1 Tax=Erythranthe guttata TaxID=4155 RepID=UPI00064DE7F0|nr:PREDICTED: uncharacterized protein LOC105974051 [Erythranthe guttata]|eukprot:XP_012854548.1 PREDICTED: uncharacterized protein LOC105974051 [Erythranthe guttata]
MRSCIWSCCYSPFLTRLCQSLKKLVLNRRKFLSKLSLDRLLKTSELIFGDHVNWRRNRSRDNGSLLRTRDCLNNRRIDRRQISKMFREDLTVDSNWTARWVQQGGITSRQALFDQKLIDQRRKWQMLTLSAGIG